jgi:hypothetical protein
MKRLLLQCLSVCFSCISFYALAVSTENITVESGFVRATIPGTSISSAYMDIINHSNNEYILNGASSSVSARVEIHNHVMKNDMMRMQQQHSVSIEASKTVKLQPSGLHLMIFDVERALQPHDIIDITLHFSNHDDIALKLPVQSIKKQHHHH